MNKLKAGVLKTTFCVGHVFHNEYRFRGSEILMVWSVCVWACVSVCVVLCCAVCVCVVFVSVCVCLYVCVFVV